MIDGFSRLSGRFVGCSRVTKYPTFVFLSTAIRPADIVQSFVFDDDYSFGILQGLPHCKWFDAKASWLGPTPRYTPESVFDTFPWPQSPTAKQVEAVAAAGREVRRVRAENLPKTKGGLRALYRTLELPGANPLKAAHAELDAAVLAAYGFSAKKDLLAQLLERDRWCAARPPANGWDPFGMTGTFVAWRHGEMNQEPGGFAAISRGLAQRHPRYARRAIHAKFAASHPRRFERSAPSVYE
jgi:hypothetical protein